MSNIAITSSQTRQTWFITGAASGFGHAFAEHALALGHNVVATARDANRLADLVAQAPDRVLATPLDVDAAGAAEAAVEAAVAREAEEPEGELHTGVELQPVEAHGGAREQALPAWRQAGERGHEDALDEGACAMRSHHALDTALL